MARTSKLELFVLRRVEDIVGSVMELFEEQKRFWFLTFPGRVQTVARCGVRKTFFGWASMGVLLKQKGVCSECDQDNLCCVGMQLGSCAALRLGCPSAKSRSIDSDPIIPNQRHGTSKAKVGHGCVAVVEHSRPETGVRERIFLTTRSALNWTKWRCRCQ